MIEVRIERDLVLRKQDFREDTLNALRGVMTFPNPAKAAAEAENLWGWDEMPDSILLWDENEKELYLPRGFAKRLRVGLKNQGYEVSWDDRRAFVEMNEQLRMQPIVFGHERDYQEQAVLKLLAHQQGMWQAPPGAGKTVGILEFARRCGLRTLVIVNKINIADQWAERAMQYLGYEVGIIGDGRFDIRDITIATVQTLWSRREELKEESFFDRWGTVVLDECHHLPATTFTHVITQFSAKYRIGVSATPDLSGLLPIMEATVGEIVETTPKQVLRDRGILVKPQVYVVRTPIKFNFWRTHNPPVKKPGMNDQQLRCDFYQAGCRGNGKIHRNNYQQLVKHLIEDKSRNGTIGSIAAKCALKGRAVLVLSSRLKHLADLREFAIYHGVNAEDAIMFTGEQDAEERIAIARRAAKGSCILFSTIADEAVDIPRLDTLIIAYPGRNTELVKQRVGRIERAHPSKHEAYVIDIEDDINLIRGQIEERVRDVYRADGIVVQYVAPGELG